MDPVLAAAAIITVGSFLLLCSLSVSAIRAIARSRRYVRVPGRIVDLREQHSNTMENPGSPPGYAPVLAFRTPDGREMQAESPRWSNLNAGKVGQQVDVVYDPADPSEAYIGSVTGTPVFLYVAGAGIVAVVFVVGALALLARLG